MSGSAGERFVFKQSYKSRNIDRDCPAEDRHGEFPY